MFFVNHVPNFKWLLKKMSFARWTDAI